MRDGASRQVLRTGWRERNGLAEPEIPTGRSDHTGPATPADDQPLFAPAMVWAYGLRPDGVTVLNADVVPGLPGTSVTFTADGRGVT